MLGNLVAGRGRPRPELFPLKMASARGEQHSSAELHMAGSPAGGYSDDAGSEAMRAAHTSSTPTRSKRLDGASTPLRGQRLDGMSTPPRSQRLDGASMPPRSQRLDGASMPPRGQRLDGASTPPPLPAAADLSVARKLRSMRLGEQLAPKSQQCAVAPRTASFTQSLCDSDATHDQVWSVGCGSVGECGRYAGSTVPHQERHELAGRWGRHTQPV
eukprot:357479-Chlamydomonas_euryale.AAC.1